MLETLYAWEEPSSSVLLKLPYYLPFQTLITLFFFLLNLSLLSHCMFHQSRNDFTNNHSIIPCLEHYEPQEISEEGRKEGWKEGGREEEGEVLEPL